MTASGSGPVAARLGGGAPPTGPGGEAGTPRAPEATGRWEAWARSRLEEIDRAGRRRWLRSFDAKGVVGVLADGRAVVSFAGNDYLGLSAHPRVVAAAIEAARRWGTGAGASRLVTGSRPVHADLEAALAEWKGCESALLFPTGFAANLGVLAAVGEAGTRILSDALNHASIVDGCRLARGEVMIWRHGDLDHLATLLKGATRAVVVTETVFSMDGDVAAVDDLVDLCSRHGALLVLDEAHAVLGPEVRTRGAEVLRVGTLSKALGSIGGFVAGPRALIDLLVNRARPFIFTTAPTPADAAAALAALGVLRSSEGEALRRRLRSHVDRLRPGHPSAIVPIVLGSETAALEASDRLLDRGLLVPAIRPPTVPPGTSRLRVTLSAAHDDDQVGHLVAALADLGVVGALGARAGTP